MKKLIFKTDENNWAALFVRVALGLVLFAHGAQKLLGIFGGFGFDGTMKFFVNQVGLPWIIGFLVIMIEFFGSLCLIAGAGTRVSSVLVIFLFIGLIYTSHAVNGFYMNWINNQKGEGIEFDLLVLGMAIALIFSGGGKLSVEGALYKREVKIQEAESKRSNF